MDESPEDAKPSGRALTTIEVPARGPRRIRHSRRSGNKPLSADDQLLYRKAFEEAYATVREDFAEQVVEMSRRIDMLDADYRVAVANAQAHANQRDHALAELSAKTGEALKLLRERDEARDDYANACERVAMLQARLSRYVGRKVTGLKRAEDIAGVASHSEMEAPLILALFRDAISSGYKEGVYGALSCVELSGNPLEQAELEVGIVDDLLENQMNDVEEQLLSEIENGDEYQSLYRG